MVTAISYPLALQFETLHKMYADEVWNHVRRIAAEVVGNIRFKGTGVCTAYNPATHSIKVMLQPHNIETGWVPIAAIHTGNGFGILAGPRVGSAEKLDGSVFDIHFEDGDPDTIVASQPRFSSVDVPPAVQSGEILLMHESGNKVFFAADKSLTLVGQGGSTMQIDPSGNITHDAKGQTVTIKSTSGINLHGPTNISGS